MARSASKAVRLDREPARHGVDVRLVRLGQLARAVGLCLEGVCARAGEAAVMPREGVGAAGPQGEHVGAVPGARAVVTGRGRRVQVDVRQEVARRAARVAHRDRHIERLVFAWGSAG